MSARDMKASIVVRLVDRFSSGLGALQNRLERISSAMRRISGVAALGAGLVFAPAIARAADLETQLRSIAVTAGVTGSAVVAEVNRMRTTLNRTALEFRTSTTGLAGALDVLTARGFETRNMDETVRMIGRVAAASGDAEANLAELLVVFDRIGGLRTPDQQLAAFARVFRAGQLGGAELRDMSRHLGTILGQMSVLGTTGDRAINIAASALQVLRDGFGTVPEAVAGMSQLLGQLLSEGTVRTMRELGVDMNGVYRDAIRRGINPIEALIQRIRLTTAGDETLIGRILPDENARRAFVFWSRGVARYLDILRQVEGTQPSALDQAATDRTQGLGAEMRRLTEIMGQFWDRLGRVAESVLPQINDGLERLLNILKETDAAYPGLIDNVVQAGGGFIVAAGAIGVLAKVLGVVLSPLRWVAFALVGLLGLKVAAFLAVVAAIAGAAYLIYKNWEGVKAFFWDIVEGIAGAFRWLGSVLEGPLNAIGRIGRLVLPEGTGANPELQPERQAERRARFGQRGRLSGFYGPEDALPRGTFGGGEARVAGEIVVRAAPGTEIVGTTSRNPDVPIVPNRGLMVAVP